MWDRTVQLKHTGKSPLPMPWAGKIPFSGIGNISLQGILNYSRCQVLRRWGSKKTLEKSKKETVIPCPVCSANPKTRQDLMYIWLIFPWPVSPEPSHKIFCHFPGHHHHLALSLSVYMKAEMWVLLCLKYQLFKGERRGEWKLFSH